MSSKNNVLPKIENRILLSLPTSEYKRLRPDLELVALPVSKILYEAGEHVNHAYFINTGMVALIAENADGGSIEIGEIGSEGIVGLQVVSGMQRASFRSMVQIPGEALRIANDALRNHLKGQTVLNDQLLRFCQVLHNQISQAVVCNRFHTFEQRLCRWLLMTATRVDGSEFPFTQEFVSLMLGANRATVVATFGKLKESGLIFHRRGLIGILDKKGMENSVCECYRANMRDLEDLYRFQRTRKLSHSRKYAEI